MLLCVVGSKPQARAVQKECCDHAERTLTRLLGSQERIHSRGSPWVEFEAQAGSGYVSWKRMRLSERGNNLSKGEGVSRLQEEKGMSLTEESAQGTDCGRILNSEHSRHPGLIIFFRHKVWKGYI